MPADDEWLQGIPTTDMKWVTGPGAEMSAKEARFRVGEVYGARSFIVNKDGWLAGVTYQKVWKPGINAAECYRVTGWDVDGTVVHTRPTATHREEETGDYYEYNGTRVMRKRRVPTGHDYYLDDSTEKLHTMSEPKPVRENDIAAGHNMARCGCGFHGYLRGSMDFGDGREKVNGIVSAHGRMVRGDRGFRAQYVELVALYLPRDEALLTSTRHWNETRQAMRDGMADAPGGLNPRWDTAQALIERISGNYPTVPIYQDIDEMLTFWPTTDGLFREEL